MCVCVFGYVSIDVEFYFDAIKSLTMRYFTVCMCVFPFQMVDHHQKQQQHTAADSDTKIESIELPIQFRNVVVGECAMCVCVCPNSFLYGHCIVVGQLIDNELVSLFVAKSSGS